MKIRTTHILAAVLVTVVIVRQYRNAQSSAEPEEKHIVVPTLPVVKTPPPPKHTAIKKPARPVVEPVSMATPQTRKTPKEELHETQMDYWKRVEERFNQQWDQLDLEQDPVKRAKLIQDMAKYIRFDTLTALEWAMSLEDPAEREMALEAINQYALSGIGAQIETDQTGLPKIKQTTIMSALGSSGMVEPGDYIVGMEDENGQLIAFEGMTMTEVVSYLRGKSGSEVRLFMERVSDETGKIYDFEVPVQRSMLVVQPPSPMRQ